MGLTSGGLGAKQSPRTRGFSGWGDIELGPSLPTPVSGDSEKPAGVRGILVAGEFDNKARAAASVVSSLSLRRYRVTFEFTPA